MEKKEKKPFMTDERKSRILFSALIAIGVPLLVFIAVPFEIWCNNIEELNYYFSDIFGFLFVLFLVSAIAIFSALFLVPEMLYKVLRGFAIGGGLMIFLQANYLNIGLNGLAGDEGISVAASVGMPMVIVNTLVWAVVITGCTVASILVRKVEITKMVSVVLALVICFTQFMNIFVGAISTDFDKANISAQLKREDPNYQLSFLTNKNLTTVGQDRNVVVFVVDRFDAVDYCEPNMDLIKGYVDAFGGFTYFNDNISMYGHTYPSLAYMLTHEELELNEGRKEYFKRAYQDNETLSVLKEAGYFVNIYTDSYYGYDDAYYLSTHADNVEKVSEESVHREIAGARGLLFSNLKMSLYRVFPLLLKDSMGGISTSGLNSYVQYASDEIKNEPVNTNLKKMSEALSNKEFNMQTNGQFAAIHLAGCHDLIYDENWGEATGTEAQKVRIAIKHSFNVISKYINEMKRLGIYDSATIIITGDHGKAYDVCAPFDRANMSALFVKPSNQTGTAMQTSSAQVSHENLWATIFKSEGITFDEMDFGESVFDVDSSVNQTRKYVWQAYAQDRKTYREIEYKIEGNGREFANWTIVSQKTSSQDLYD